MIPRYAPTYSYKDLFHSLYGRPSEELEAEIISRLSVICQAKYVILLNNARSGLYTILRAYNRPGRVLIPAYNCISVPEAVNFAGYQPEFVDIDLNSLNVLPEVLENAITSNTIAVLPTHLFGIPCNIEKITQIFKNRDIFILEDAAPALGAEFRGRTVGCFGDASVISFGGRKVIYGETGGAILTNNEGLFKKIHEFLSQVEKRSNKWGMFVKAVAFKTALTPNLYAIIRRMYALLYKENMYEIVPAKKEQPEGYLSGIADYASTLIQIQLDRLEWNLGRRRKIAQIYREKLNNHPGWLLPKIPEHISPTWIQFPMICDDKQAFYNHMRSHGLDTSWTYRYSCAESFAYNNFPIAREAAQKVVSLPTTPFITDEQAEMICSKALKY